MYRRRALIKKIKLLGKLIHAPERLLDGYEKPNQYAQPYIEIKFPFYYLIISENGREVKRQRFLNAERLLYAVFEIITFDMALQYELMHRVPLQDSRRVLFFYQLKLMEKLSAKWHKQLQNKIAGIVTLHPYQDGL